MSSDNQYFIVIDFEATCTNKKEFPASEMEIIEFAGMLINTKFEIIKEFSEFVKPIRHQQLTEFCTELTTITQQDVDQAKEFSEVLKEFNIAIEGFNPIFLSWGNFDKNILIENCEFHKTEYPFDMKNHINIKQKIAQHLELKKAKGVSGMLKYFKMDFIGTPHRGIDDVRNIVRILKACSYPLKN